MTRKRKTEARKARKLEELVSVRSENKKELKRLKGGATQAHAVPHDTDGLRIFPGGSP